MRLRYQIHTLHLRHTFRLSQSASDVRHTVVVELEQDGITGRGECVPSASRGETVESVCRAIESLAGEPTGDPRCFRKLVLQWQERFPGQRALLCGLDVALYDWAAQSLGIPLYRLWGLDPEEAPPTSMTVAIAEPEAMLERVREAEAQGFQILKIKVGFEGDVKVLRAIRAASKATVRVDANGGWSLEQARKALPQLAALGIQFVEQPLPAEDVEGLQVLRREAPLPIFLDESVQVALDVPKMVDCAHGVVLKLAKCGGLWEAQHLISTARAVRLQVMIGCMIETSVGLTAAAHLAPLVDYADLDSSWLIRNDPFRGVGMEQGMLRLPNRPGIGVVPAAEGEGLGG